MEVVAGRDLLERTGDVAEVEDQAGLKAAGVQEDNESMACASTAAKKPMAWCG